MVNQRPFGPLVAAATCLGIGMGGFVDGIVFHQLLQAHNMLSAKYPTRGLRAEQLVVNLEINMFWDGLFHGFTWITTSVGLMLLWNAVRRPETNLSTRAFVGSLVLGWGLFNTVEGIIDHHILHIHHVTETQDHLAYDIAFLVSGAVMILGGWLAIRSAASGTPTA
jgi:uncharacterized membrane protein